MPMAADTLLVTSKTLTLAGTQFNESLTISAFTGPNSTWTLPSDQTPGTPLPQAEILSVVASPTAGTASMLNPAPGISTGSLVDGFWTDSYAINHILSGPVVGTVVPATVSTSCTIAFSGGGSTGAGTPLPA